MAIKLLIDSTNYLSPEDIAHFDMRQVSLFIHDGDRQDRELDMDFVEFYKRLADTREIPKSAQPAQSEIRQQMLGILDEGHDVLGLTISKEMSGTYETYQMVAEQIKQERPDGVIEIVDTRSNCLQEGYAILSAAVAADAGASMQECIDAAKRTIARTRFVFAPHTLEYLERGGRIGAAAAMLGSLLKLVPILSVEDGEVVTLNKVRTCPKALAALYNQFEADIEAGGGLRRFTVHTIADSEHGLLFRTKYIEPLVGGGAVEDGGIVAIGPVIGAHVGSAVGIVYETNNPLRKE
jgi:DegV family protein with EDD domain